MIVNALEISKSALMQTGN